MTAVDFEFGLETRSIALYSREFSVETEIGNSPEAWKIDLQL